jgi:quinol monooxygenase YgiN
MSVTVVHDYYFKPDGDVAEGKAAAKEFVDFLKAQPGNQLTLWLEDRENPLHHFHINVFDSLDAFEKLLESDEVKRFSDRLYLHTARRTHVAPLCDVWLAQGRGVEPVPNSLDALP